MQGNAERPGNAVMPGRLPLMREETAELIFHRIGAVLQNPDET